jgi:ribonucleoside-diphosphate reductase alpha chain
MRHDSLGEGVDEGMISSAAPTIAKIASNGYVRSKLVVLTGGARSEATTSATSTTSAAAAAGGGVAMASSGGATAFAVSTEVMDQVDGRLQRIREARMKGYEGDACGECGNFTLVRNGTCLKCDTCGSTSGCS